MSKKIITYTLSLNDEKGPTCDTVNSIIDTLKAEIENLDLGDEDSPFDDDLPLEFSIEINDKMTDEEYSELGEWEGF